MATLLKFVYIMMICFFVLHVVIEDYRMHFYHPLKF